MRYSYIIPVYNCKAYIEECVNSILAAELPDLEILLVDDGSTDGSGAVCDALAERHPQVRVIHQPNGGASAARNRGLQEAEGEYILFADADDTLDAKTLGQILRDPGCVAADMTVFGLSFDYYYHGKCYRRDPLFFDYDGLMTKGEWGSAFLDMYLRNSWSPLCNKVFRRELLRELVLNENMFLYEDLEFVLRYLQRCDTVRNVPRTVYGYRQAEDEGNAGRRLKRIHSIPEFLRPIEYAMATLCQSNAALTQNMAREVLLRLHLTLAREKITVSGLGDIRRICRDFAAWCSDRSISPTADLSPFFRQLVQGKATQLLLAAKKTALRHKIAVWAKGNGLYKKR